MPATNVLICTPCYGGQVTAAYLHSILHLLPVLERMGIGHKLLTKSQESLISRARNTFAAEFLGRKDFSHLLFLDADIGFEPEAVVRMVEHGGAVVATAYPMKGLIWERIGEAARAGKTVDQLRRAGIEFAVNTGEPGNNRTIAVENGFIRVQEVGSGMLLIARQALEKMTERFPESRYVNDIGGYDNEFTKGNFWTFFEPMVQPETGRYLSEDYAFCYKWVRHCGGEIFLNIDSKVTHVGSYSYQGHFLRTLQPD
jgi:hypothetical protein